MPPKRTRKSGRAAASKHDEGDEHHNVVAELLKQLQGLLSSKTRCSDVLQSLVTTGGSKAAKKSQTDAHLLLATTHVINQLIRHLHDSSQQHQEHCEQVGFVLAAFVHALASVLVQDKSKLERQAAVAAARSVIGRAMQSITVGCVMVLKYVSTRQPHILWKALTTLEMMIHLTPKPTEIRGFNASVRHLIEDASEKFKSMEVELDKACRITSENVIDKEEVEFLAMFLAPAKGKGIAKKKEEAIQALMDKDATNTMTLEGRGSVRRWAPIGLMWLCRGQYEAIDAIVRALSADDTIADIWSSPSPGVQPQSVASKSSSSINAGRSNSKGGKRKSSAITSSTEEPRTISGASGEMQIPGNVAIIAFCSRLIDLVSDCNNICGVKPPSDGTELYVASIFHHGPAAATPTRRGGGVSRSRKRDDAGETQQQNISRPDVRDVAMVALDSLIRNHFKCMGANYQVGVNKGRGARTRGQTVETITMVNDQDDLSATATSTGHIGEDKGQDSKQQQQQQRQPKTIRYYPLVYKSVENLCRFAVGNVVNAGYTEGTYMRTRLMGFAAALVLGLVSDSAVMDAKLVGFAIGQLSETLRNLTRHEEDIKCLHTPASNAQMEAQNADGPSSDADMLLNIPSIVQDEFQVMKPFPTPDPTETSGSEGETKTDCTFAGIYPLKQTEESQGIEGGSAGGALGQLSASERTRASASLALYGDILSLFVRAMNMHESEYSSATAFVSNLIWIIDCCYATEEAEEVTAESNRQKQRTSPQTRPRKRSKRSAKQDRDEAAPKQASSGVSLPQTRRRRLGTTRCTVATETLGTLRMCFVRPVDAASISSPIHSACLLRSWLHRSIRTEHCCDIVKLSYKLDDLLKNRLKKEDGSGNSFSSSVANFYDPWERSLWSAHIKLNLTVGRGQTAYDSRDAFQEKRTIMLNAARRLSVFQAIAASSYNADVGANIMQTDHTCWPLCLPVPLHALAATNMTSEPLPTDHEDASPEVFVAEAFFNGIIKGLDYLNNLESTSHKSKSEEQRKRAFCQQDQQVPLSLRDARLFILAVCRLPKDEKREFLAKLLECVRSRLSQMTECAVGMISCDETASAFLARLIVICGTLIDMVSVGKPLLQKLCVTVGPAHYDLPSFTGSRDEANEWCSRDITFMGVFNDWKSPCLPVVALEELEALNNTELQAFQYIIERGLNIGFRSVESDHGHLLFASWNSAGKFSAWISSTIENEDFLQNSDSAVLMLLRDDLCDVFEQVRGGKDVPSTSLLTELVSRTNRGKSRGTNSSLQEKLLSRIRASSKIIDCLNKDEKSHACGENIDSALCAKLEIVAIHISSMIAFCTESDAERSSSDRRSRHQSKSRSSSDEFALDHDHDEVLSDGSSDSGYHHVDQEEDEDARIESLARIHDSCNSLGVAPIHPDWLDSKTQLREGISKEWAIGATEEALSALVTLGSVAYRKSFGALVNALDLSCRQIGGTVEKHVCPQQAVQLYSAFSSHWADLSDVEDGVISDTAIELISSICQIDESYLNLLDFESVCRDEAVTKEAWCPESAQRIHGRLHDLRAVIDGWEYKPCELRSSEDWEFLIADALLGSCFRPEFDDHEGSDDEENNPTEKEYIRSLTAAHRWQRVYHAAIEAMVPVTALLRFCSDGGKGRDCDPFAIREIGESQRESSAGSSVQREPHFIASPSLKTTAMKALALAAQVSVSPRDGELVGSVCAAIAGHLLYDMQDFADLEAFQCLRNSFDALGIIEENLTRSMKGSRSRQTNESSIVGAADKAARKILSVLKDLTLNGDAHLCASPPDDAMVNSTGSDFEKAQSALGFIVAPFEITLDSAVATELPHSEILALGVDWIDELRKKNEKHLSKYQWIWNTSQESGVHLLVSLLCQFRQKIETKTRLELTRVLALLVDLDILHSRKDESAKKSCVFVLERAFVVDQIEWTIELIKSDVCVHVEESSDETAQPCTVDLTNSLAELFVVLASCQNEQDERVTKGFDRILDCLLSSTQNSPEKRLISIKPVVDLIAVLGVRCDKLEDICFKLLSHASLESGMDECAIDTNASLHRFLRSVRQLKAWVGRTDEESTTDEDQKIQMLSSADNDDSTPKQVIDVDARSSPVEDGDTDGTHFLTSSGRKVLKTCSFVQTGGDFQEQHWYNCYTCGLVWDKGCCSLCAQVCHQDHDVGYSRFSSFFCDCGAEVARAGDEDRVACKCLTPLTTQALSEIYNDDNKEDDAPEIALCTSVNKRKQIESCNMSVVAKSATPIFVRQTRASVNRFLQNADYPPWNNNAFKVIRKSFQSWREIKTLLLSGTEEDAEVISSGSSEDAISSLSPSTLHRRNGTPLDLQAMQNEPVVPVRTVAPNSFNVKLPSETTSDYLKKTLQTIHEIQRNAIATDSRGRVIVAEPYSLVFLSALPIINTRYSTNAGSHPLEKSSLPMRGTAPMKFSVVGMQLCPQNESRVVVWGASQASVLMLNGACDGIETRIDLTVNVDPHECEADYVLKCAWMPGSDSIIAVICIASVKFYDLKNVEGNSVAPVLCYALAYEGIMIRDCAFVNGYAKSLHRKEYEVTFVLMLDTGRLHFAKLKVDSNGDLQDQGDRFLEYGEEPMLPTEGVRQNKGSSGSPGSSSSSFGEGSTLTYLPQSGLLLYKCITSCVLALTLDDNGSIAGSFEFLPHSIDASVSKMNITGPYSHWTELGIARDGDASFYRVVCVGKSTKTHQQALICVEFNADFVRFKDIPWPAAISAFLSAKASLEGVAAFSAPTLVGNGAEKGFVSTQNAFFERGYIMVAASNGSLAVFGEESVKKSFSTTTSERKALVTSQGGMDRLAKPTFPLTIFETFTNISEIEELTYGGDGVGLDSTGVKRKLSTNNGVFMISPSREGCTITLALRKLRKSQKSDGSTTDRRREESGNVKHGHLYQSNHRARPSHKSCDSESLNRSLAIVAVRVLVGSTTTEYIPKTLSIMGRRIDLIPRVKRWYDLPLTDEEIVLGIRNGFVSVGIGASFDTTNKPLIDCFEVYATDRQNLGFQIPTNPSCYCCQDYRTRALYHGEEVASAVEDVQARRKDNLVTSLQIATELHRLLGGNAKEATSPPGTSRIWGEPDRKLLHEIIQTTALETSGTRDVRQSAEEVISEFESDQDARRLLLDNGTIFGVVRCLSKVRQVLTEMDAPSTGMEESEGDSALWTNKSHADLVLTVLATTRACLRASLAIARVRPKNYERAVVDAINSGVASASVAVTTKLILDLCFHQFFDCTNVVPMFIELILIEMGSFSSGSKNRFADSSTLSEMLLSRNARIVEKSTAAILKYTKERDLSLNDSEGSPPIAYKCDSCDRFPITETRYTLEGGHDIDLCQNCYNSGFEYANGPSPIEPLLIHGKPLHLGQSGDLTCRLLLSMRPMAIASGIVRHVEEVRRASNSVSFQHGRDITSFDFSAGDAQMNPHAIGNNREEELKEAEQDIISKVFVTLVGITLKENQSQVPNPTLVVGLLLNMIFTPKSETVQLSRAKQFAQACANRVYEIVKLLSGSDSTPQDDVCTAKKNLVTLLRALSSLVSGDVDHFETALHTENSRPVPEKGNNAPAQVAGVKEKTDPRFVCQTHGVPAVRRRCSHGVHKDRRFYVCGMARRQRCKYFKWADSEDAREPKPAPPAPEHKSEEESLSSFQSEMGRFLWKLFNVCKVETAPSLQSELCELLETNFASFESIASDDEKRDNSGMNKDDSNDSDDEILLDEKNDGVLCSRSKLGVVTGAITDIVSLQNEAAVIDDSEASLLCAALEFLARVADTALRSTSKSTENSPWSSEWLSLLCEIISTSKSSHLRAQAKQMLKGLFGGRSALYHHVRDHYVFAFQLRNIIRFSAGRLKAALQVKEKARQCGPNWRINRPVEWSTLGALDLLGTSDLISEDSVLSEDSRKVSKVLDELLDVAKSRGGNLRQFCALAELPCTRRTKHIRPKESHPAEDAQSRNLESIARRPPIAVLMWIASILNGANQTKLLKLLEIALNQENEKSAAMEEDADDCGLSTDAGTDIEPLGGRGLQSLFPSEAYDLGRSPEFALAEMSSGLSSKHVQAFALQFVLKGKTPESRSVAIKVAASLIRTAVNVDRNSLLMNLLGITLMEMGALGQSSTEMLNLLQIIVSECRSSLDILPAAQRAISCFVLQMGVKKVCIADPNDGLVLNTKSGKDVGGNRRFDLCPCVHCHRRGPGVNPVDRDKSAKPAPNKAESRGVSQVSRQHTGTPRSGEKATGTSSKNSKKKPDENWLPEQVRPFVKSRLEAVTSNVASAEFASYVQLKYRLAVSAIHLSINDPRGRFVKTISVYFSQRPVSDANDLKKDDYAEKWQRCGTLNLTRGAVSATCNISVPVIAANLKFEYLAFYEKGGGSRSSDGSIVLHCPRCSRMVNNAHGVCGNCGEVAFQCRKCRHINYDRLDAFMCVECGYCASGGFSYSLMAGIASNAVAILTEEDYDRTVRILRVATRLHGDLKKALKKKLGTLPSREKRRRDEKEDDHLEHASPALKRALEGELPFGSGDGGDSGRKTRTPSSTDPGGKSLASNKARSLLRLARHLRSDASSTRDSDRRGELTAIRQAILGSEGVSDPFDDDIDIFGIINAGGGVRVVSAASDALGRLVANMRSRNLRSSGGDENEPDGDGDDGPGSKNEEEKDGEKKEKSQKVLSKECDRLYQLMREAERECHELQRKIDAWNRLETDTLTDPPTLSLSFTASACSVCSGPVTLDLLNLVMAFLQAEPSKTSDAVTKEFIESLFDEPAGFQKEFYVQKREAIRTLVVQSEKAARLVLEELSARLRATQDVVCAEILGKLIPYEFPLVEDYIKLAMETLQGNLP